ncbi:MAG: hypothetical protein KME26_22515 [Oscillatoria princeps RMCB-10]|nr:hypothetical protein [Oscillatoria princeps RMCB-10]
MLQSNGAQFVVRQSLSAIEISAFPKRALGLGAVRARQAWREIFRLFSF